MDLQTYLTNYNLARDIRPSTLEHYEWVVKSLRDFLGRPVLLNEIYRWGRHDRFIWNTWSL